MCLYLLLSAREEVDCYLQVNGHAKGAEIVDPHHAGYCIPPHVVKYQAIIVSVSAQIICRLLLHLPYRLARSRVEHSARAHLDTIVGSGGLGGWWCVVIQVEYLLKGRYMSVSLCLDPCSIHGLHTYLSVSESGMLDHGEGFVEGRPWLEEERHGEWIASSKRL